MRALYDNMGYQEPWRDTRSALKVDAAVEQGPPLRRLRTSSP